MIRKGLAAVIILFLIIIGVIPSTGFIIKESNLHVSSGNILYVGGSGPNNYTKIQYAIDNASDDDTVFVYHGTYFENVVVNKHINLVGEDKNSTIIDAQEIYDVIKILSDEVFISGFTIQNSGIYSYSGIYLPSYIHSNNIIIYDNIITENQRGITNYNSSKIIIQNNIIYNNKENGIMGDNSRFISIKENNISYNEGAGLDLYNCYKVDIIDNTFYHNIFCGISLAQSPQCFLLNNSVELSIYGLSLSNIDYCQIISNQISFCDVFNMQLSYTNNSIITGNLFSNSNKGLTFYLCKFVDINMNGIYYNNEFGIVIINSSYTNVSNNNFKDNYLNAYYIDSDISWNNNYWDRFRILPKMILGRISLHNLGIFIPMINFDWHPASEPYDIKVL